MSSFKQQFNNFMGGADGTYNSNNTVNSGRRGIPTKPLY